METQTTFLKAVKAAGIAGLIGAGANNIWSLIANALGATIPPGFALAVTLSSLFPVLIGGIIYFLLMKYTAKGKTVWYVIGVVFSLLSLFPVFNTPQLPDGTVLDSTFPLLAAPMHIISGVLATWGIPRWSK
ncbi:MAG: DUF6069 family protein [Cyclobacteriaceae bacterium]|jgi:hypothetical protein